MKLLEVGNGQADFRAYSVLMILILPVFAGFEECANEGVSTLTCCFSDAHREVVADDSVKSKSLIFDGGRDLVFFNVHDRETALGFLFVNPEDWWVIRESNSQPLF